MHMMDDPPNSMKFYGEKSKISNSHKNSQFEWGNCLINTPCDFFENQPMLPLNFFMPPLQKTKMSGDTPGHKRCNMLMIY